MIRGTLGSFSPEEFVNISSRCLLSQIVEVILVRFFIYDIWNQKREIKLILYNNLHIYLDRLGVLLIGSTMPLLDILSICGFKFVGLFLNKVLFFMLGSIGYYPSILYFAFAFGLFFSNSYNKFVISFILSQ